MAPWLRYILTMFGTFSYGIGGFSSKGGLLGLEVGQLTQGAISQTQQAVDTFWVPIFKIYNFASFSRN